MANNSIAGMSLDELFSRMPTGSLDRAVFNNLRGVNHRQVRGMVPSNREQPGLIFFTRPQLNMQPDNIRNVRWLSQLLSRESTSMQTYIRCMLDPRLMTGISYDDRRIPEISCPLVDNKQAFIPILTNNYISNSGWPSISVPTFTSKAGLYNESISMVDGRVLNSETWDLNVNFRNSLGDPILFLFFVWCVYMSFTFEGKLAPYTDFITENEFDFNTRIYRIVLDYRRKRVTKIASTAAAFPLSVPLGDSFNSDASQTYSEGNKEINMSFRCMGVDYFDPIIAKEFNSVVEIFNPAMKDEVRTSTMVQLSTRMAQVFNHEGYPHINTKTMELEWWVDQETFSRVTRLNGGFTGSDELDAIPANFDIGDTGD